MKAIERATKKKLWVVIADKSSKLLKNLQQCVRVGADQSSSKKHSIKLLSRVTQTWLELFSDDRHRPSNRRAEDFRWRSHYHCCCKLPCWLAVVYCRSSRDVDPIRKMMEFTYINRRNVRSRLIMMICERVGGEISQVFFSFVFE